MYINRKCPYLSDLNDVFFSGFHCQVSYWKRWKTDEVAKTTIKGTREEGYALLEVYRHVLLDENEGSKVYLKVGEKGRFR